MRKASVVLICALVLSLSLISSTVVAAEGSKDVKVSASKDETNFDVGISVKPYDKGTSSETQVEYTVDYTMDNGFSIGAGFFTDEETVFRTDDDYYLKLSYCGINTLEPGETKEYYDWRDALPFVLGFGYIHNPGDKNWDSFYVNILGFLSIGYNFGGEVGGVANYGSYDIGKGEPDEFFVTFAFDWGTAETGDIFVPIRYNGDIFGGGLGYNINENLSVGFIKWGEGDYHQLYQNAGVNYDQNEFFIAGEFSF